MKTKIIIGMCILTLLVGCGYIPKEEASNWEWDGKISSLSNCYYTYVIANEEPYSGWNFKGMALSSKEDMNFPVDCKTAYEVCNSGYIFGSFTNFTEHCSFEVSHSYGCGGIMCDKNLYKVSATGKCVCTLDDLQVYENSSWLVKKR